MTSTISNARAGPSSVEPLLLVEEISHRVVNELTVAILSLRHEAGQIVDTDARIALQRVAVRLSAFAEAHRALRSPEVASDISLGDYLSHLFEVLCQSSLRDHKLTLVLLDDDIILQPDWCWRIGLILTELVTNSVKHGLRRRAGAIVVEVGRIGAELRCAVADDGGVTTKSDQVPSHGSRIVQRLAAELGGGVHWNFRSTGVTAVLKLPLAEDAQWTS
jgi:two-component sensor histidine kinase